MPALREKDSGRLIGRISDEDVRFLIDELEEESSDDREYFIDEATIQMLEDDGGSDSLISLLRDAVADQSEGLKVEWTSD